MLPRTMDFFRGPIEQPQADADVVDFPRIFVHGRWTVSHLDECRE